MVVWHLFGGHTLPQEQLAFLSHLPVKIIVVPFTRIKNNLIWLFFYAKNFSVTPNNSHRESLRLCWRVPKCLAEFCFLSTKMLKLVRFLKKQYKIKQAGSLPFWIIVTLFWSAVLPRPHTSCDGGMKYLLPSITQNGCLFDLTLSKMTPIFAEESKWPQREREIFYPCFWVFFVLLKTNFCYASLISCNGNLFFFLPFFDRSLVDCYSP